MKQFDFFTGNTKENSLKPTQTFCIENSSRIYKRHQKKLLEQKALVPRNFAMKPPYISKNSLHSRCDKSFEKLYEISPRRKKEKLRSARLNSLPGTRRNSFQSTATREFFSRQKSEDLLKPEPTLSSIKEIDTRFRSAVKKQIDSLDLWQEARTWKKIFEASKPVTPVINFKHKNQRNNSKVLKDTRINF